MFLQELSRASRALQDARRECIACHAALAGDACTLVMKSSDGKEYRKTKSFGVYHFRITIVATKSLFLEVCSVCKASLLEDVFN